MEYIIVSLLYGGMFVNNSKNRSKIQYVTSDVIYFNILHVQQNVLRKKRHCIKCKKILFNPFRL